MVAGGAGRPLNRGKKKPSMPGMEGGKRVGSGSGAYLTTSVPFMPTMKWAGKEQMKV
jgi:hypothetical protein